ncbi:MAG: helix-turn-helix domain-containing protein [Porticoccaceae bacterium]
MNNILAPRLRAAREAITPKVSQREVAKRVGLTPAAVNLWETGKTEPSASNLAELARWYKVSTDWLLGVEVIKPARAAEADMLAVPLVAPIELAKWRLNNSQGRIQTMGDYPAGTAAAVMITNDALASICPAGSYAVISKAHTAEPGSVVMAVIADSKEPILRRLVSDGGIELLVADDTRFQTHNVQDGARIIGRAIEVVTHKVLIEKK